LLWKDCPKVNVDDRFCLIRLRGDRAGYKMKRLHTQRAVTGVLGCNSVQRAVTGVFGCNSVQGAVTGVFGCNYDQRAATGVFGRNPVCCVCCRWGCIAARHPYLVLIAGAVICTVLSFGIYFASITSDPVHLWSSPNSRTRIDKNYFDKTFA